VLHDWSSIVRYAALLLLFLLAYALLLRPLKKQVLATVKDLPARVASQQSALGGTGLDSALAALPPEQRALLLKKQLVDKVKGEPAAAGQLIHAWINEEAT
jgi:flagellar M-ring protein FliF